jgi:nucleoside-diphosphate-sugar epimerase
MLNALVLGGGGFIGSHMVTRLKKDGYSVTAVDLKYPEYSQTDADYFELGDLRSQPFVESIFQNRFYDEVYQFAADMGGAGFVFSGENDAEIMHNSSMINLNVLEALKDLPTRSTKIFYSSSACMYPEHNQLDPQNPNCAEDSAYPANPDSEYGWEKLFSERIYLAYNRNHQIPIAIARFHNIYGPLGTWCGGREKAPAAICRKIALSNYEDSIEVWGDGLQTRSFLFIDDCINAVRRLMQSDYSNPINIGSEEMVTINQMVEIAAAAAGKKINRVHKLDAPIGVRGRNSDNRLIRKILNWDYEYSLREGLEETYAWIESQVKLEKN